jgi:hypothetical protein
MIAMHGENPNNKAELHKYLEPQPNTGGGIQHGQMTD